MVLTKNFGGFSETFDRVFDKNPTIGKGSGVADTINALADFFIAQRENDARKEQALQMQLGMAKEIYGDDMEKWPLQLKADMQKRYGLFGDEGKPITLKQPPKVEQYEERRTVEKEVPNPELPQRKQDAAKAAYFPELGSVRSSGGIAESEETMMQPEEIVETKTREVPQPDVVLPTTKKEMLGNQAIYTPIAPQYTMGQLAQITGKALPPSVDPATPIASYRSLGIDPMNMILQGLPSLTDLMNGISQSQQVYQAAFASQNPSQFVEAYNDLNNRTLQFMKLYPEAKGYLPWKPEPFDQALERYHAGWQYPEMNPAQSMAQGLAMGDAYTKSLVQAAATGGWAAVENIIYGVEENRNPNDPFYNMIPRYQIDDRKEMMMNADGTPMMQNGKPVYNTIPGLRTRANFWYNAALSGEQMDFELAKMQFAQTMINMTRAMRGGSGGGTGRRSGGTGGGPTTEKILAGVDPYSVEGQQKFATGMVQIRDLVNTVLKLKPSGYMPGFNPDLDAQLASAGKDLITGLGDLIDVYGSDAVRTGLLKAKLAGLTDQDIDGLMKQAIARKTGKGAGGGGKDISKMTPEEYADYMDNG